MRDATMSKDVQHMPQNTPNRPTSSTKSSERFEMFSGSRLAPRVKRGPRPLPQQPPPLPRCPAKLPHRPAKPKTFDQYINEFGEATGFVAQQFLWRSEFGNRPIIHHQNKIRVQDRVETVGNRDHSALLELLPHHFLSILVRVKYW